MRLPSPQVLQAAFRRRGFVLVSDVLDPGERSALFDVACTLVRRRSTAIDRTENEQRLWYSVVTGDRIEAEGAPLFAFYTDPDLLSWIRELTACPSLGPSPHLLSAINVNCLHAAGQKYPWHQDAVPYTGLLFLSSIPAPAGGMFSIRSAVGELVNVPPVSGDLVFMDGTRCPHAVSPLADNVLRLTVPMVYPREIVDRPAGLDEYLYGP